MNNYELLIHKLDAFIRKYYFNQLLRGILVFAACLFAYLLLVSVGEYFFYFPAWLKMGLVSLLLVAGLFSLAKWIVLPLLKIQRLGKTISHEEAARIIGLHFTDVSDKLLNILQLMQNSHHAESRELIEASIEQKSSNLVLVPFVQAVDLGKNKKYLPFALVPLAIGALIAISVPALFRDAGNRLLQANRNFEPPAPFTFQVTSGNMEVPMYGSYKLETKIKGSKLPEKVYVQSGNEQLEMQKTGKNTFAYTFTQIAAPLSFRMAAAGVHSSDYSIKVKQRPTLTSFTVDVLYPQYTGRANEHLQSLADMAIPAGTLLKISLKATNTSNIFLRLGSGAATPLQQQNNNWLSLLKFMADTSYTLLLSGKEIVRGDSFTYHVQVIPDLAPTVQMQEMKDSITGQQLLLTGNAGDDYGIGKLYFHYSIAGADKQILSNKNIALKTAGGRVVPFQHYFDIGSLDLQPGQELSYYIEAWDNDAVNGSKSGRSDIHTYRMPDAHQADSAQSQNSRQINQGLSSSAEQAKDLQKELKEMQNELLQSESMSWEQQQNMKSLEDKQMQLKNQVGAVKKRFDQQKKQSEQKQYSEEIKEKQEAVEKQLDNLLNKELQEQLKKLQEMQQQRNKENAFQNLQQMEQQNKLFNMDLERIQELIRKLEMQMKMEDLAAKMENLATQEDKLNEQNNARSEDNKQLAKQQDALQNQLKQALQNDMKEIEKLNNSQQNPEKTDDAQEQGKEADKDMEESSDQLQQNNNQKASKAQQNASNNMRQMAKSLMKMAAGMDAEQIEIDIKATRQILTNLLRFSFDQENLMNTVKHTPMSSPKYVENSRAQNRLQANARMIKDSLFTLGKRVFQIAATVNKETTDLESNINSTIYALENRRLGEAVTRQQYAMTSANNLALLLNELLENLMQNQAQAQASGQGKGGKPKPGSGGGAGQQLKDIITGQQQLGQGMQKGMGKGNQQQQGQQPGGQQGSNGGGGNGGGQGSEGDNMGSEQIARMARQQAALRRQIQELSSMLNSKGMSGNARQLKAIQDAMDKNETDMVNRKLNSELWRRQQEIMTRLLEAEKSIRDQEEDNKRNANAGKDEQRPMPPELKQYLQSRQSMLDMYRTTPPELKPYYRKMADDYLKQIKQNN
ncbi:MAG: DUF4175 family protein [Edaphocola sp.]